MAARTAAVVTLATVSCALASPLQLLPQARNSFGRNTSGRIEAPYDALDTYMVNFTTWNVHTNPTPPVYLPGTADQNFIDTLRAAFPITQGWSYSSRGTNLEDDSFLIHTYDSEHDQKDGRRACPHCVGAEFDVEYKPHGTDPTTDLHWIQVVTDSDGTGFSENVVDNPFSLDGRSPYYDDGGAANALNFYDFPRRPNDDVWHIWQAELFLVKGPNIPFHGAIEIEGGIRWGWQNVAPEPGTWGLMAFALIAFGCAGWRKRKRARQENEVFS